MDASLRDAAKEFLVRYGGDLFPNLFVSAKGTCGTGRYRTGNSGFHLGPDVRDDRPQSSGHRGGGEPGRHQGLPHVQRDDPRGGGGAGSHAGAGLDAGGAEQVGVRQHRLGKQRGGAADGEDAHRRLRGAGGGRFVARPYRRGQRCVFRQRPQGLRRAGAGGVRDAGAERVSSVHQGRVGGRGGAGVPGTRAAGCSTCSRRASRRRSSSSR